MKRTSFCHRLPNQSIGSKHEGINSIEKATSSSLSKKKSRLIPIDSLQSITKIQCQREASQKQNVQSSKAMTRDRVKKGFVNNL